MIVASIQGFKYLCSRILTQWHRQGGTLPPLTTQDLPLDLEKLKSRRKIILQNPTNVML